MSISSSSPPKIDENLKESMVTSRDVVLSGEHHASLFHHVLNGDTRRVIELLDGQAETTDLRRLCRTALLYAVRQGHLEIMTEALKRVATCVEESEIRGIHADALQDAAWRGHIDIVTKLIDEGADVNAEGGQHEIALHAASIGGWREVAAILLAEGARTDKQDRYGLYPLQLAIKNGHQGIANDLLPKCTNILASIKASEWRNCYGNGDDDLELYFDPMPAIRKVSIASLIARDYPLGLRKSDTTLMSESSQNFMVDEIKSKRVFFLANGALLATWKTGYCCVKGKLFCRMPFYHQFSHVGFLIQPERSTVQFYSENKRQLANSWPLMDHDEDRHHGGFTTTLEPRAFFTTSEYAQFPPRASALLTPLIEELQSQWKRTFETAQQHLSDMRISVLKARGLNGDLIQALLNDSLLWDQVKQASRKQISDLKEFRQRFFKSSTLREPATQPSERTLPEDTQDSEESDLQAFGLGVERLQSSHEMELKALKEMSQSLIQLEFNLTSIAEAQLSRSNNMSMKRLSWITFIFLPLMFVASVFGMNIDALASNPHWHWPVIIAIPTALVAFSVVFVLRWMEHRKPLIPDLEEGEQEGRHDRKMEGWASRLRMTWFSAGRRKRD